MTSIASTQNVRDAGGLLPNASGGATDAQCTAALLLAQNEILSFITKTDYEYIRDYTGSDADELEMQEAFRDGEARFAVGFLPKVLSNVQLAETGFKTESQIGKTVTRFGNADDIATIANDWLAQGMLKISPYLDLSLKDECDNEIGLISDDGSMSLMAI